MMNKKLSEKELSTIIGGDAYNPGTNNWGSGMKGGGKSIHSSSASRTLANKINTCIAYGFGGIRGPFGCDSN
ncbi:bacteriocin [Companilactobacillus huachuanensis]|uniref:Bacteriocin n=1 Tax=Companilactobacillus huachuanensis TaxID=2559914 RepID=A0ABW1RJY7_9LACO|nr:bacteriocin [Companilactobacillus huachuanensis]